MKKYILCLLCLILIGCHHSAPTENSSINETDKESSSSEITNSQEEASGTSKESESDSPTNNIESQLNHDEIMAANFSSIAGEYVNPEGDVIFLDEDGLNDNERQTREVLGGPDSGYSMGIHPKDELDGGYLLMIFPEGIEVPYLEGLTDTTKIRIYYGQDYPISTGEIYTKK